ncbi:hypothetical protein [Paenibacillus xerothermodurans]|uniref:Glycosyl hydrolase n=1 Tax=Paenibacillus xerothermodurans TaxID=1977292 RepID=A0A2W1NAP5_PAEXE|nr:hypothetical protein [Paenibacillus xerothermodurans]PZE20281.1 hypothetical protein CBW46_014120 [Paenibacillus xerothermodurans]
MDTNYKDGDERMSMAGYQDIRSKLELFLQHAGGVDCPRALDVGKETYLDIVEGIVGFFGAHQADDGRIIDPIVGGERQYSTPCYAAAAACLARHRGRADLIDPAARALTVSLHSIVAGNAACDNHGNFYTVQMVHAYRWLQKLVSAELVAQWEALFRQIQPALAYQQAFHNWSVVAQAGEALRVKYGLGGSLSEIDEHLEVQLPLVTELGLYVDPNGPLAYDVFSRLFFRMMLNAGYDGRHREFLTEYSRRGAITSLFVQSPTGEILLGGRSAQHQWNEAGQCYVFESYANEYAAQGDTLLAGIFKRAAKLSLASVARWVRPSGELNIVRNWFDPNERVGYESYSFHSQYNLLAAFMMAACYELADDGMGDVVCPAEAGGFVLSIEPHFRKLVVNAGGYYAVVQTKGERKYNPTGIVRIQKSGLELPIGPADMVSLDQNEGAAISYAVSTLYRGRLQRLADLTRGELDEVTVDILEERQDRCVVAISYIGGLTVNRFRRVLTVDASGITVEDEMPMPFYEEIPVMLFDGRDESQVEIQDGRVATVQLRDERQTVTILTPDDEGLEMSDRTGMSRNGRLGCLQYAAKGNRTAYRISLSEVT